MPLIVCDYITGNIFSITVTFSNIGLSCGSRHGTVLVIIFISPDTVHYNDNYHLSTENMKTFQVIKFVFFSLGRVRQEVLALTAEWERLVQQ